MQLLLKITNMGNLSGRELLTSGVRMQELLLNKQLTVRQLLFLALAALCLTPSISAPIALTLGIVVAQTIGHPWQHHNNKVTGILLKASVIGLGFGMNIETAMKAGQEGFVFSVISIAGTLLLGVLLGKLFRIEKKTSLLVASGTAICGGSAIAAVAPVMDAKEQQISIALGVVFVLNSVALFIFPEIGTLLHMSQHQFGLWSAIAIHDTSSVVGATSNFGNESLQIATTVKLARSLWIVPVAALVALLFRQKMNQIKLPWFIAFYIIAMLANTWVPAIHPVSPFVVHLSKTGLTLTLFLIGAGLSREMLKGVGWQPMAQGILLWAAISVSSLIAIMNLIA